MKRINPKTNQPFKYGDIREDGYVFVDFRKTRPLKKCGFFQENWLHPEKFNLRAKYAANKKMEWRETNYEYSLAYGKYHRKTRPAQYTAKGAKRRAAKLQRTPKWLTAAQLKQIADTYAISDALTKITGIPHEVDHVVPLQGKNVSGLHVPWNLHVKTAEANRKKSNKHEV